MKILSVFVVLAGLLLQPGFAQKPQADHSEMRKARKEMKAYAEENILPVIREQRAKLDAELSAQEQSALASIREELKSLREEGKELRPVKQDMKRKGEMPSQEERDAMRSQAKARRLAMDRAWAIAYAHETTIFRLIDEVAARQEQWHNDMKTIMDKYRPEQPGPGTDDLQKAPDAPAPHPGHRGPEGHMGKGNRGNMGHMMQLNQPVFFLLWDGKDLPGHGGLERQGKGGEDRVQVVPNPASGSHEVTFKLESAGTVTFTLLDYSGKPIQQVYTGEGTVGNNTVKLPINDLKSGLYFYKIDSPDGEKAVRFYVN